MVSAQKANTSPTTKKNASSVVEKCGSVNKYDGPLELKGVIDILDIIDRISSLNIQI